MELNSEFSKDEIQMSNENEKTFFFMFNIPNIREMHVKTALRFHLDRLRKPFPVSKR